MSFLKMAARFVRVIGLVAFVGVLSLGASSEASASTRMVELAVKGSKGACVVTQIDHTGDTIGVYQNILHTDGTLSGPSPDRFSAGNPMGKKIEQGVKNEANYVTTLNAGEKVAFELSKDGTCVVSMFSEVDGRIGLYQVIVHTDGTLSGPSPDFVTDKVMKEIASKAMYIIKAE